MKYNIFQLMQLIKCINHLINGWVVLLKLFSIILIFSTNASYFDIFYSILHSSENSHCYLGLHFVSIFSSRIILRLSLNNQCLWCSSCCWNSILWNYLTVRVKSVHLSVMSDSVLPWNIALQAPLSMVFSRQEHWSG